MLKKVPKIGSVLYYVVKDFDGKGLYKVKVSAIRDGYYFTVGLDKELKDAKNRARAHRRGDD
jgi:hypothetical protein